MPTGFIPGFVCAACAPPSSFHHASTNRNMSPRPWHQAAAPGPCLHLTFFPQPACFSSAAPLPLPRLLHAAPLLCSCTLPGGRLLACTAVPCPVLRIPRHLPLPFQMNLQCRASLYDIHSSQQIFDFQCPLLPTVTHTSISGQTLLRAVGKPTGVKAAGGPWRVTQRRLCEGCPSALV